VVSIGEEIQELHRRLSTIVVKPPSSPIICVWDEVNRTLFQFDDWDVFANWYRGDPVEVR